MEVLSPLLPLYLNQFLIFVLVLTRTGALIMTLPVLGGSSIPIQVRAILADSVAMLIAPLHWGMPLPDVESLGALGLLLAREMILAASPWPTWQIQRSTRRCRFSRNCARCWP